MERQCAARSLDGIDLAALRVRAAGRGGERDVRGAGENSAGREVVELTSQPATALLCFSHCDRALLVVLSRRPKSGRVGSRPAGV